MAEKLEPMVYLSKAQSNKPPHIANDNAFLGDVVSSKDSVAPISAGFYRQEKGKLQAFSSALSHARQAHT